MRYSKISQVLVGHLFSFKLPSRLLAILAILFLTFAVGVLTYRGGVEIWGFFKIGHIAATTSGKFISQMMGWMMGLSTFVQSGPIIWDKLSAWGQQIDNLLMKFFFHQHYFLDEVGNLLKETRNLINAMNAQILETSKEITYAKKLSHQERNKKFGECLKKAYKNCEQTASLLKKHETYDNWSQKQKTRAEGELNNFIVLLTEIFQKNRTVSELT